MRFAPFTVNQELVCWKAMPSALAVQIDQGVVRYLGKHFDSGEGTHWFMWQMGHRFLPMGLEMGRQRCKRLGQRHLGCTRSVVASATCSGRPRIDDDLQGVGFGGAPKRVVGIQNLVQMKAVSDQVLRIDLTCPHCLQEHRCGHGID